MPLGDCVTESDLCIVLLLLEKFLRHVQTFCVALHAVRNSPVHGNGVINYAITVRVFRTVLRDRLKKLFQVQ